MIHKIVDLYIRMFSVLCLVALDAGRSRAEEDTGGGGGESNFVELWDSLLRCGSCCGMK